MKRSAGLAAVAALLVLSACGQDTQVGDDEQPEPTETGIAHPSGADDVVVRITTGGGYTDVHHSFTTQPTVLITGDGRIFSPGVMPAVYPGPLVAPVGVGRLSEEQVQGVLEAARAAGLLEAAPDYAEEQPLHTDDATTTVLIQADGEAFEHSAYALGSQVEESGARKTLLEFIEEVSADYASAGEEVFTPEQVAVLPQAQRPRHLYQLEGSPDMRRWPQAAGKLQTMRCVVVDDPELIAEFNEANQLTFYRSGGKTFALAVRPMLPGDPGCDDVDGGLSETGR